MGSFDAELKLVIAGNHDISLDGDYWSTHLGEDDDPEEHQQAVDVMIGSFAKEMGLTYLTEGLHSFTLKNGTTFTLYCTPYQPECGDWAFAYKRNEDRFNFDVLEGSVSIASEVSAVPNNVDMMRHGPPKGMLDLIPDRNEPAGCDALFRMVKRVRPLLHCFGHIHKGYGLRQVVWDESAHSQHSSGAISHRATAKQLVAHALAASQQFDLAEKTSTLMVNAAIMDDKNQPTHGPWMIELDL